MSKTFEFVELKVLIMPCCHHQLCWVNPRWPTHCPECGATVYPKIKNPEHTVMRTNATLAFER